MKKLIILLSILALNETKDKTYCDIKGNVKNPGVYEIKDNYTIQNVIEDAGGLKKNSYTKNINLSKKITDEMVIYIFTSEEIEKIKELNNCICETNYKYIECQITEKDTTNIHTTTKMTSTAISKSTKQATSSNTKNKTTKPTISTTIESNETTNKITTNKTTTTINKTSLTPEKTTSSIILENIININTATKEELTSLKGLGDKKAEAIIEYRNNYGPFETIDEIMKVSGIGESTFEKIKNFIKV